MKQIKDEPKSEREISRMVIDKLNNKRTIINANKKKKTNIPDMNTSTMRDFIGEEEGE